MTEPGSFEELGNLSNEGSAIAAYKLGEARQFEWENDAYSSEVMQAFAEAKKRPECFYSSLELIADKGSRLAMLYLGDEMLFGSFGGTKDLSQAEIWLRKCAELGSIEGRFRLAECLELRGHFGKAEKQFVTLAEQRYAPAMYRLAFHYWKGVKLPKDRELSRRYFDRAIEEGHMYSKIHLAKLQRQGKFGFWRRFVGIFRTLLLIVPAARLGFRHPQSDHLRR